MLPRDVLGLSVPAETVTLSRWAPYVEIAPREQVDASASAAAERDCPDGNPVVSLLEWGLSAVVRAGSALRRAA